MGYLFFFNLVLFWMTQILRGVCVCGVGWGWGGVRDKILGISIEVSESEWDWLLLVTCNDISVIYLTAHRCAGGQKKKMDLGSGSQRHRHFVGFFNVPVQTPMRGRHFIRLFGESKMAKMKRRGNWSRINGKEGGGQCRYWTFNIVVGVGLGK